MIKNYLCSKCQNLFTPQEFPSHYNKCQGFTIPSIASNQINAPSTVTNYPSYNTTYTNQPISYNTNNITYIPSTQSYIPKTTTTNINQSYRPQTAIYMTQKTNQIGQNINNNNNPQYYNYNNNYGSNMKQPINSLFICNICKARMPLSNKNDHMMCHKLEQEDKDLLAAKKIQDDDIFGNVSPDEVEQQLKIEQIIHQQQQQRRNNNNNFSGFNNLNNLTGNNINFINDDFNSDPDFANFARMGNMNNTSGSPNIIIRRIITNGNSPNFGDNMGNPDFLNNFFNNNNTSGMGRIMIPISFTGNRGGQNDLNEMIENMLHYTRENPTDAAIVSELPETKIDDIKKLDKDKQNCVICMEDFKNGDKTTNLPCLHMFHTNCIQSWLKTQNTCPICKFKLTPNNINNINRSG